MMMQTLIFTFAIVQTVSSVELDFYDPEVAMELLHSSGAYLEIVGQGPAFGNEYLQAYDKMQINCNLPRNVTFAVCQEELVFDVYDENTGTVLETKTCTNTSYNLGSDYDNPRQWHMQFYFPFNDPRLFGRLRCRYYQNDKVLWSNNSLTFPFMICAENSHACQESAPCDTDINDQKYCVATKDGPKSCTSISDSSWCDMDRKHTRYCPVNEIGACNAAVKNTSASFFTTYASYDCPKVDQPPLSYNGKSLLHNEPFNAGPPGAMLRLKCPRGSPFFNAVVKLRLSHWPAKEAGAVCVNEINFNLSLIEPELFTKGAISRLLTIDVDPASDKPRAKFANDVIDFGTELDLSGQFGELRCAYTSYVSYDFRLTRWWTKESTGTRRLSEEKFGRNENNTERNKPWTMFSNDMTIRKKDVYQCHVLIEYKSCAPHRLLKREISSAKFEYHYSSPYTSANTAVQGYSGIFPMILLLLVVSCKSRE